MYVDADDVRPPSLLERRPLDRVATLVGIGVAAGTHVVLPLALAIGFAVLSALGVLVAAPERRPVRERQVVEARFAKLGRPFDPRQLPNRRVNIVDSQLSTKTAVSKNMDRVRRERPDAGVRNAREARLANLGTRAQLFAELAEQRLQEGNPEGIEGGTEQNARAGDIYAGQLYMFFRRGWTIPDVVDRETLQGMTCEVDVDISTDAHVADFRLARPSGNPLFDQSVLDRLQEIKTNGTSLPRPPEEIADDYLGRTIGLRFRGRDAR